MAARTYGTLKAEVLALCNETGSTDAGSVVDAALPYVLKYVAARTELPGLLATATETWGASTTSLPIEGNGTDNFGVTAGQYLSPNRLYVARDSSATAPGIPYNFYEYLHWLDLKAIPGTEWRTGIFDAQTNDERADYAWTINHSNEVIAYPVQEGNVLTLVYSKAPAAYASGTSPEIPARFDYILVNGASLILKEWVREPDMVIDFDTLLAPLDPQIALMDSHQNTMRKRNVLKIAPSYRIR